MGLPAAAAWDRASSTVRHAIRSEKPREGARPGSFAVVPGAVAAAAACWDVAASAPPGAASDLLADRHLLDASYLGVESLEG